jgi:chromosome segregation protein
MLRVAVSKTEKRIAELQDEISGLAIRRETTEENRRGIEIAISDARGARDKAQNEIAAARAAGEAGRKNLELLTAALQASQDNLRQHRLLLTDAEKGLVEIERALVEKESRLEILRQLNEEGEGLGQGSQAVLKGLDNPARIHAALGGALVSNLDVDSEYVAAIEAALGRNLQAIVLKDAGLAPAILAKLNEKKFGQAALALPSLSNYSPKTQTAIPRKALAWANDKVKAPEPLAPLVTRLLGNVAVFGDLEEALSFKKDKHNLAPRRSPVNSSQPKELFGGSRETSTGLPLQRKAQMAGLNTECADVRRQRDALLQKRDKANAALRKRPASWKKPGVSMNLPIGAVGFRQSDSFLERELRKTNRRSTNFARSR